MPRAHRSTLLALFAAAAIAGVLFGALAATPSITRAGRLAGISGAGVSGIQIVNLSPTSTMTAVLDAYRQAGGAAIPIIRSGIAPLAAADIFLPAEPSLRNGAYAGILSSDQPHAAIGRTDWPNTGGSVMFEEATAADGAFIPVVYKQYAGQTSMISIQNMSTSDMRTVDVEVRASGSPAVVASSRFNIMPGTSVTLDLSKHPGFQSLPPGFVGTMQVAPTIWDGPGWPIAVNAIVDIETSPRAVYSFGGDAGDAQVVYVPRFRAEETAPFAMALSKNTTLIAVANPRETAEFKVTYTGLGGGCAGQVVVHGNRAFTIPGGSNLLFDPGAGGALLATGASGLPAGCFGTAKVEAVPDPNAPGASLGVAAVVIDVQSQRDPLGSTRVVAAGAYNAFAAADAANTVHSPLFRNQHVGLSTEVTAMNLGSAAAEVELSIEEFPDGTPVTDCGDACRAAIAPGASYTFRPDALPGLANGLLGSATIASNQPIIAIVDDFSIDGTRDTSTFRAIKADPPADGARFRHSALPWMSRNTAGTNPTPSPAPTIDGPSVDIFAIGFVDVAGGADPACPGCDGDYDPEDEQYAEQHPLPSLTFVLRDDQGQEVARVTTTQLATLQRGLLRAPELTGSHFYTLDLIGDPQGYQLCGNDVRSRRLYVDDFQLGSTREDFHFTDNLCIPNPNITPIPTRTPGPIATPWPPGTQPFTIFAIGFVDVFGGANPSCPGCDGVPQLEDEAYAIEHPLPRLTFVVKDKDGLEIARAESERLAYLQRAQIDVPELAEGEFYTLELLGNPAGWQLCANESRTRRIEIADFQLDSTRQDFHFNTGQCMLPTTPVPPAPVAGPKGIASTGVMLVNVDPASASDIQMAIRHQISGDSTTIMQSSVPPQESAKFSLVAEQGLGSGAYAGMVSSDAPVRGIINTYWFDQHGSTSYEDPVPAADVLVPLVVKGAGGQNSLVTIQNYDTATATDVEIKLADAAGEEFAVVTRSVAPGASITLDIGRDLAFSDVPLGFVGTLRARAALRIAVQAFVDVEHSPMAIYGYQGEPAVAAAGTLFVPRVHAGVPVDPAKPGAGLRMTRIVAANPGTVPVQVALTLASPEGTCAGQTSAQSTGPVAIAAGGMRWLEIPSGDLPAGCTAAARIDATGGGVLALVVDTVEAGQYLRTAGAYNAFTAAQAGLRTIVPGLRKPHPYAWISTDIAAMNVSSDPAAIVLRLRDARGQSIDCPTGCQAVVAPGATHTFVPEAISVWPPPASASAVVESDQPVVVTVTEESRVLAYDMSIYRGAAAALTPSDIAPSALALPLLANQAQIRLDGPALTPPDPGWIDLPSLAEPLHTLFLPIVGFLLDEPLHR